MHVDHVGWLTRLEEGKWVPTCPNATYLFVGLEWEHWNKLARDTGLPRTGDYIADSVRPVVEAGKAELVEVDHEIEPGVRFEHLPGHTPGQVGLHLSSGGRDAVLCGDAMHHAIQCLLPGWATNFCTDGEHAVETRKRFQEKYADTGTMIFTAHSRRRRGGTSSGSMGRSSFGSRANSHRCPMLLLIQNRHIGTMLVAIRNRRWA